jgi:cob(I)alamin adenosyltransferase
MLYSRKGDDGKTKIFGCDQSFAKSSIIAEALGSLDEINSYLGVCKVLAKESGFDVDSKSFESLLGGMQQNLFIVQAEVAGADKAIEESKLKESEEIIDSIEKQLPPINTFFVSGGTELSANLDFARTLARKAERRVVAVHEEGKIEIDKNTLAYLNRLSSFLYALARLSNHKSGINEERPSYK